MDQVQEGAAVKARHAAELRAQMQAVALKKQAAAEAAKRDGARAREATAIHMAVIEVLFCFQALSHSKISDQKLNYHER
jgi:hypothetical protein